MRIGASGRRSSPGATAIGAATPSVAAPASTRADTADIVSVSTRSATVGNAAANSRHSATSTASGNNASTHSDTDGSSPRAIPAASPRSASTSPATRRAAARIALPGSVSVGTRVERSNTATSSWRSRLAIAWLTADWTRRSRLAAAEKLPASATAVSTRSWSSVTSPIMPRSIA
ncbi:hypothetical protein NAEX_00621 [Nannocystis exedens]|nr:hypothetical protein NAEX_00621 [Nannocystis exedens]